MWAAKSDRVDVLGRARRAGRGRRRRSLSRHRADLGRRANGNVAVHPAADRARRRRQPQGDVRRADHGQGVTALHLAAQSGQHGRRSRRSSRPAPIRRSPTTSTAARRPAGPSTAGHRCDRRLPASARGLRIAPRIAASPRSYGVFERHAPAEPGLPDGAGAGRGDRRCRLRRQRARAARLPRRGARGREAAGRRTAWSWSRRFLPLRLAREDGFAEDMRGLDATLGRAERRRRWREPARRPALRCASASPIGCGSPARSSGIARRGPASAGSGCCSTTRTARPSAAASAASRRRSSRRPARTSRRRARCYALLEHMDASLLGLCFDAGHSAFGGGDPAGAAARRRASSSTTCTSTDVDLRAARAPARRGRGFEDAVGGRRLLRARERRRHASTTACGSCGRRLRRLDRRGAGSRARARARTSIACSSRPSATAPGCASAASELSVT